VPDFRCTYRLQLSEQFGFRAARELAVGYIAELGASHLYLSPSLQARHGSSHGYDVVDPTRISEELGGEAEFRALCAAAREAGLGVVLDIVPNHMAVSEAENPFWRDRKLRAKFFDWDPATGWYRRFFDIDELAGVRVEDPEVFDVTHEKILELVHDGLVDGLRVDHPDGLANPREYLDRLRQSGANHVWVEKILHPGEALRDWPVEGTIVYRFGRDTLPSGGPHSFRAAPAFHEVKRRCRCIAILHGNGVERFEHGDVGRNDLAQARLLVVGQAGICGMIQDELNQRMTVMMAVSPAWAEVVSM
jgi:(1->4)-alpha-D-glucan 1-alpha-D-glucosylmutase